MKLGLSLIFVALSAWAHPWDIWYGGDPDGRNGFTSERNALVEDSQTYDHFTIPYGIRVDGVFGNFFDSFNGQCATAFVDIRQGVSEGTDGVRVFSGVFDATSTDLGYGFFDYELFRYNVEVGGVDLRAGTYFLAISPINVGAGRDFIATTSGANSVRNYGHPDGNQFMNSDLFGARFENLQNYLGPSNWDLSYGLSSNFTPEPATGLLLGSGTLLLLKLRKGKGRG